MARSIGTRAMLAALITAAKSDVERETLEKYVAPHVQPDRVESFYQHGMEGMVLSKPKVKPLVHRCECSRPISSDRHYCRACMLLAVERVVTGNADRATVAKVAQQSTSEERVAMI